MLVQGTFMQYNRFLCLGKLSVATNILEELKVY